MEREETEAILAWMKALRDAWKVTNSGIVQLAQAQKDYQLVNRLALETMPHIQAMDAAEKSLRDRLTP